VKVRLTKVESGRWVSGAYTVRLSDWSGYTRYVVNGPGISDRASYGGGNDIRTLAEVREVIAAAKEASK
jgi:hypothetical protein